MSQGTVIYSIKGKLIYSGGLKPTLALLHGDSVAKCLVFMRVEDSLKDKKTTLANS